MATLYGRFATRVNGSSPLNSGRSADVRASASLLDDREAVPRIRHVCVDGMRQPLRDRRVDPRPAVIVAPVSRMASVSDPNPGPTSSTRVSAVTAASRTMRRTVPGSMTKFWPNFLVGLMPASALCDGCRPRRAVARRLRVSRRLRMLRKVQGMDSCQS